MTPQDTQSQNETQLGLDSQTRNCTTVTGEPNWQDHEITTINPAARKLLEDYSHIPPDEVLPHVRHIRERALAVSPWACIAQGRFIKSKLQGYPFQAAVIAKLHHDPSTTFLDAGCCLGQELRYLTHNEDVAGSRLFGLDLEPQFHRVGYELFRDEDRLGAALLSGDLLAEQGAKGEAASMDVLEGKMDIVHVASVLHAFDWDDMIQAARRLVSFAKPIPGSMVVGSQLGSMAAGSYVHRRGRHYRHNQESMAKFWRQVGEETGTQWKIDSGMVLSEEVTMNLSSDFAGQDTRFIWFVAERM